MKNREFIDEKVIRHSTFFHPKFSSIVNKVLANRRIDTLEKVDIFVNGGIECLYNPFLFNDMEIAVKKIRKAIDLNKAILVYGDKDVDGITAVNVIVNTIRFLGGNVKWYIPSSEGYGIHDNILLKYAIKEKIKVLITADCGTSSTKEIDYAKTLGMDVIIADHHEPNCDKIPNAEAIINPKNHESGYPFRDISGCVVSLKIMQALMLTFDVEYNKKIMLCYCIKKNDDYCGNYIYLKNDLKIKKNNFRSIVEIKNAAKMVFMIYTNNVDIKNILVKKNIFLKDKIVVLENNKANNIDDLFKIYKAKKNKNKTMTFFFKKNLDLCALSTIADCMPLIDENRIIVKEGLKIIKNNLNVSRPGLNLLMKNTIDRIGIKNRDITAKLISLNITPVLNSSGRMSKGILSAKLLMTNDMFKAKSLYNDIIKLNKCRKSLQSKNIKHFEKLLKKQCNIENDKILMIKASNIKHGVTGVIASQMAKTYMKPTFLFITDGEKAIGAARAIDEFNLIAALESVKDILIRYGGHYQAAGFVLKHSKINEFKKRILNYADENLVKINANTIINVEDELKISDLNIYLYKQIKMMEPFGIGNSNPIFCIKNVIPTEISFFGNHNKHLRFKISQNLNNKKIQAIFWNKSKFAKVLQLNNCIDVVFNIEIAKNKTIQLNVIDVNPSITS
ncbi:MAG: single-stranded-DNA-specific exonuclease RecJ [Endomicrobium sp.]|jgi:single-stranded-DNA-specific exonuclease|nr:single-stranded-DNA-specific exonuclease RecJ [Endomicrobium sp.]